MALHVKNQPRLLNVNRRPSQPKKRKKINLVFDDKKRRDFLTGFHKRKVQRQKKAQEELQQKLKEERKRIKHEARERYKKLVSSRDIPEIEELLSQHEYETEGHTVSILELNVADLAENNALIGENKGINEVESKEEDEEESNNNSENNEEIVGMPLSESRKVKNAKQTESKVKNKEIGSRKELKKEVKKAALKQVKKSKVFQQKQKMERQKNKKESLRKLKKIQKVQKRSGKLKKKLKR